MLMDIFGHLLMFMDIYEVLDIYEDLRTCMDMYGLVWTLTYFAHCGVCTLHNRQTAQVSV